MKRYNQHEAIKRVIEILNKNDYEALRVIKPNIEEDLKINHNGKQISLLVRHLEKDHAYKNSPLPYKIYKVEAFDDNTERDIAVKVIDFVIGYNFNDECFACVPIEEFRDKRSTVVHEKEGNRHEYFNSLLVLKEFLK